MTVYYTDANVTVHAGDCLDVLAELDAASVDSVCTDPPYALAFMGRAWDSHPTPADYQTWCQQWAAECLRVLKPGGHLLTFGGSRTWHRLAAAIEDAGFEIRDSIAWLYGSGFPKSLDVSKAIDKAAGAEREVVGRRTDGRYAHGFSEDAKRAQGATAHDYSAGWVGDPADITAPATDAAKQWQGWGTALKPAFEPIIVARKPLQGTVAQNVLKHGTGAVNVDGCRVEAHDSQLAEKYASVQNAGARANTVYGKDDRDRAGSAPHAAGRWPTNVLLDGEMADELDRQSGITRSRAADRGELVDMRGNQYASGNGKRITDSASVRGHDDSGGASRFFPTFRYTAKAATAERPSADGVAHPTVKPLELMRWLVRLVTPPGGTVLDPFAGTGTTGEACIHEHKHAILIEREPTYLPLIVARLSKPMEVGFNFDEASA